ncbi:hypothetical protein HK096_000608 [Nowakowskiella sp. JEL0078]|nr:hypothetical protein HK096_000608 [Nowakowskiella sp. JEL0078]
MDTVLDHIYELNDDATVIRHPSTGISPDLVFGLDSRQFLSISDDLREVVDPLHHATEIDVLTLDTTGHIHNDTCGCNSAAGSHDDVLARVDLEKFLETIKKEDVYRVKGFVRLESGEWWIVNWAFGRLELVKSTNEAIGRDWLGAVRITVMGIGLQVWIDKFCNGFAISKSSTNLVKALER